MKLWSWYVIHVETPTWHAKVRVFAHSEPHAARISKCPARAIKEVRKL